MQTAPQSSASPVVLTISRVPHGTARATAAKARPRSRPSIGSQLERDRLEQRAVRVRQVIHALRERAEARDAAAGGGASGVPRPLRAAIEDFGRELADLERRLRHHAPAAGGPRR